MLRRSLFFIASLFALVACRVDVAVHVAMDDDGSGEVTLIATADADVVAAAPGLADDLRFDDLVNSGWTIDGPQPTDEGGLTVTLLHPFSSPEQASALVASLNGIDGPFKEVTFARVAGETTLTFTLDGAGRVDSGLAAFADPDLLASVGATPYADEVAAANLSPSQAVVVTFSASLPGSIDSTTSTAAEGLSWTVPLDGTSVDLASTTTRSFDRGGIWSVVSLIALALLIVWAVVAAVLIAYVVYARQQRRRRRGPPRVDTA